MDEFCSKHMDLSERVVKIDEKLSGFIFNASQMTQNVLCQISEIKDMVEKYTASMGNDIKDHITESVYFRNLVEKHEEKFKDLDDLRRWLRITIISVILSALGTIGLWIFQFATIQKTVEVNSGRIEQIEKLHPRVAVEK